MLDIFFIILFVLLFGAPGIIWLVLRPQWFSGRFWLTPPVVGALVVMLGGAMLNQLMGWSEFWGFLVVWVSACVLAWWVPTYERNRRGRLAAAARLAEADAADGEADSSAKEMQTQGMPAKAITADAKEARRKLRNKRRK